MNRYLLSALTLSLLAGVTQAADTAKAHPKASTVRTSGIAAEYVEPSVRPQDDFFMHLNGKWLKEVEIPADKSSWGSFAKLRDDTLPQLRTIIEKSAATPNKAAGTDVQRIGDY